MPKPKEEQLRLEISQQDKKGLWLYLDQSRKMKKEAELIEDLVKERCKELMGEDESLALDGDAGVYIQYSPRYEVPYNAAREVIQDETMLYDITKIDMTKAKAILPGDLYLLLKTKQELKGEPTKKLMVGKIKGYEA